MARRRAVFEVHRASFAVKCERISFLEVAAELRPRCIPLRRKRRYRRNRGILRAERGIAPAGDDVTAFVAEVREDFRSLSRELHRHAAHADDIRGCVPVDPVPRSASRISISLWRRECGDGCQSQRRNRGAFSRVMFSIAQVKLQKLSGNRGLMSNNFMGGFSWNDVTHERNREVKRSVTGKPRDLLRRWCGRR